MTKKLLVSAAILSLTLFGTVACQVIEAKTYTFNNVKKVKKKFLRDDEELVTLSLIPASKHPSNGSVKYDVLENGVRVGTVKGSIYSRELDSQHSTEYPVTTSRETAGSFIQSQVTAALGRELRPSSVTIQWVENPEGSWALKTMTTLRITKFTLHFNDGVSYYLGAE